MPFVNSLIACSAHAVSLIHTFHAAPLHFSDSAVSVKVRVVTGNIRTASRTLAAHRPSLDGRAVLWPWEERHGQSMAWARHDKCESITAALCKSNGTDTF